MKQRFSVRKADKMVQDFDESKVQQLVDASFQSYAPSDGLIIKKDNRIIAEFSDAIHLDRTVEMDNKAIRYVLDPTHPQDVATKVYVDRGISARREKCDIYLSMATQITSRDEFQYLNIISPRMTHFSTLDAANNGIILQGGHYYRIEVIGFRKVGLNATLRLVLVGINTTILRTIDVRALNNVSFNFAVVYTGAGATLKLDAKKGSEDNVEFEATIVIDRI